MMRNVSLETLSAFYLRLPVVCGHLSDETVDLFCGFCSEVFSLPLNFMNVSVLIKFSQKTIVFTLIIISSP